MDKIYETTKLLAVIEKEKSILITKKTNWVLSEIEEFVQLLRKFEQKLEFCGYSQCDFCERREKS